MKCFLISDNRTTLAGMRLAGIEGVVVHEREEVLNELKKLKKSRDIGIVIITEILAEKVRHELDLMKRSNSLPAIIEIPDRHGFRRSPDFLTKYIRESIGVQI